MHNSNFRLPLLLIFVFCTVALLLTAGCYHSTDTDDFGPVRLKRLPHSHPAVNTSPATNTSAQAHKPSNITLPVTKSLTNQNDILGNEACRGCHSTEFDSHKNSRHRHTLYTVDAASLGHMLPPEGPVADSGYTITAKDKTLYFTQDGKVKNGQPMQLALGSGKTGMTYVHVVGATQMVELRMSYFPNTKQWIPTPGQEGRPDHAVGLLHQDVFVRQCILCHATKINPKTGLPPSPKYFGVGCESCHGPGRAHVAAMKKGDHNIHMERLSRATATRLNSQCGECHGLRIGNVPAGAVISTNRFQSYALMKSRCFLESNKSLSCSYCHNVHSDASIDTQYYESRCLSCHSKQLEDGSEHGSKLPVAPLDRSQGVNAVPPLTGGPNPGSLESLPKSQAAKAASAPLAQSAVLKSGHAKTICPVNARSGCIECHMPKSQMFPGSRIPTLVPDHYIRTYHTVGPQHP